MRSLSALLVALSLVMTVAFCPTAFTAEPEDHVARIQAAAIAAGKHPLGHWGVDPENYTEWGNHSNRLVPIYTFGTRGAGEGVDLDSYTGASSPYRSEAAIQRLYGRVPVNTLNPQADYADQTNVADIQRAAIAAGKKHVFLVVFDGMDWQTSHAAATYRANAVKFTAGRGTGLHFLDYSANGTSQFGSIVTSPKNTGTDEDVDQQTVRNPGGKQSGGYNAAKAGPAPWIAGNDLYYALSRSEKGGSGEHAYPDSAATATSMCSGIKTFNGAIGVDAAGAPVSAIAHEVQELGWSTGAVSSVPVSHATPACAYAHNVTRNDYQDITRDMLGLPSISHHDQPLQGLDVVIGGGFGSERKSDAAQGKNFVAGNRYLAAEDLAASDVKNGGRYHVAVRTAGQSGAELLEQTAAEAVRHKGRLLGFFGVGQYSGHLPFRTANGDYQPVADRDGKSEKYSPADIDENPTLAQMTSAAISVLEQNPKGFWLMVEAGDVDWANHSNNIDNSIGAVLSGDEAVKVITDWVEHHSNWDDSLLIVTADHGHYLHVLDPSLLTTAGASR